MALTGKIALATGGIGGATARLLAARGAQVAASGRDLSHLSGWGSRVGATYPTCGDGRMTSAA